MRRRERSARPAGEHSRARRPDAFRGGSAPTKGAGRDPAAMGIRSGRLAAPRGAPPGTPSEWAPHRPAPEVRRRRRERVGNGARTATMVHQLSHLLEADGETLEPRCRVPCALEEGRPDRGHQRPRRPRPARPVRMRRPITPRAAASARVGIGGSAATTTYTPRSCCPGGQSGCGSTRQASLMPTRTTSTSSGIQWCGGQTMIRLRDPHTGAEVEWALNDAAADWWSGDANFVAMLRDRVGPTGHPRYRSRGRHKP